MTPRNLRGVAWGLVGLAAALLAGRLALGTYTGSLTDQGGFFYISVFIFLTLAFVASGAFIVIRQPRNTIGWLLLAIPVMAEIAFFMGDYATYGLVTRPGSLPAARWAAWIDRWDIVPTLAIFIPLFLLFPDGRLPSRRWRPVLSLTVTAIGIATLAFAVTPGRMTGAFSDLTKVHVTNPVGLTGFGVLVNAAAAVAGFATLLCAFLAGASLVVRFRSRHGDERQQVKWLAFVGVAFLSAFVLTLAISSMFPDKSATSDLVGNIGFGVMFCILAVGIPAACAIAIVKHRLYDLDVVINKTVVYAALAGFITLVYVGIVVGIGTAIGQGSKPNLGLSIVATAVVAVAFQPVRARIQRFANRLVYGKRATPYEVLAHFAERMASTYTADELLPHMARILAEGTGAAGADVWLKVGRQLRAEGWPADTGHAEQRVEMRGEELPTLPHSDLSIEVRDRGELLGALAIKKGRGEPVTQGDRKLLSDLASQAGLVLRNVKLIEELRASRQRIVSARDEERRRLERNIHDGAQRHLVDLGVKLGLAEAIAPKDLDETEALLAQLQGKTQDALDNLRDLARGIYPPLLRDQGLVAAVDAQARKASIRVFVEAGHLPRYTQDIEAAVYFCTLEALQNVAKHAAATTARVTLTGSDGHLTFTVSDDGVGFDPERTRMGTGMQGMADRLSALGGGMRVESKPGGGTKVSGELPVQTTIGAS